MTATTKTPKQRVRVVIAIELDQVGPLPALRSAVETAVANTLRGGRSRTPRMVWVNGTGGDLHSQTAYQVKSVQVLH